MVITRAEAIVLSSFFSMMGLPPDRLKYLTESALAEFEVTAENEEMGNKYLREYITLKFSGYTNEYLTLFLGRYIVPPLGVKGKEPKLHKCPCCGYRTLEKTGEYFICRVCFWEDDGITKDDGYSSVNNTTLGAAKENFKKWKAVTEKSLAFLDEDRFLQFNSK